ncbi:hypothetical protein C7972_11576 [Arenibacter sp. ARW7G5Y1]|nr:hypothetical protein C7972_11576 [Arenibacter sp. ARW7G5Y1]
MSSEKLTKELAMHKVILIILATVVNELVAAHSESKLVDNSIFYIMDQYSRQSKKVSKTFVPATLYSENGLLYIPVDNEPSWELFPNFKPRGIHCVNNAKLNLQGFNMVDYK